MKRLSLAITMVLLVVAIDQGIKFLVETQMGYQERIAILPFFDLFRTHNTGIAFSLLSSFGPWVLSAIAIGVTLFVSWLWTQSDARDHFAHIGFALIIGGAIGNLIDRTLLGYVVDYFLFYLGNWSFAVFNLADAAITVGAILVALQEVLVLLKPRPKPEQGGNEDV